MTYRMADSVDPNSLPSGMDAYAGYDDGNWPDYQAIAAAHPGAHLLELTVWLADRGQGIDDEPGDATDAQTVTYVTERLAAGVWRPVVYASISRMTNIVNLQSAAGHPRSSYRLLSAHYDGGAHICGPATCRLGPQCDGTQWVDHGGWDESLLDSLFFGPIPNAPTPYTVTTVTVPNEENLMPLTTIAGIKLGPDGNGWIPLDGSVQGVHVDWDHFRGAEPEGSYPPVDGYWPLPKVGSQNRGGVPIVEIQGQPGQTVGIHIKTAT